MSVNKVILVGRVGANPEQKKFDWGSVTSVSLATSESWKDKATGERKEKTEWHRLTFRNKLADIAANYLSKGSQIYVEGQIRTRRFTDSAGIEKFSTEIEVRELKMLDSASDKSNKKDTAADHQKRYDNGGSLDDDIPF